MDNDYEDADNFNLAQEEPKSKLPGALGKRFGPLSVGAWIIVIVGGLLLAWLIRRMWGAASTTTTPTDYSGTGIAAPDPVASVEPVEPLQPSYMEVLLQWPDEGLTIEQEPIEITFPEGVPVTTPQGITVGMPGMETVMGTIATEEARQTKLAQITALQAQIAVIVGQIGNLTAQRARLPVAQRGPLTARIKALRARKKALQQRIRAIRQGGTAAGSGGSATTGGTDPAMPF